MFFFFRCGYTTVAYAERIYLLDLRTLTPILLSLCTQIHTPCHASMHTLSNKVNNDRTDSRCYIALPGFNDLGYMVTPIQYFAKCAIKFIIIIFSSLFICVGVSNAS